MGGFKVGVAAVVIGDAGVGAGVGCGDVGAAAQREGVVIGLGGDEREVVELARAAGYIDRRCRAAGMIVQIIELGVGELEGGVDVQELEGIAGAWVRDGGAAVLEDL